MSGHRYAYHKTARYGNFGEGSQGNGPHYYREDHNIIGGLGAAVAEAVLESGIPCKFKRLGIPDVFAELGDPEDLYAYYGYDGAGICAQIKKML